VALQVALAPNEQKTPGTAASPKSIVPDTAVLELNFPVMSKRIPTSVLPEKENPLLVI
jgi:hypothetical protein